MSMWFEIFAAVCLGIITIGIASMSVDLDTIVKMYKGESK